MTIEIWLTFVVTATIILVIPGPTIIYVIGQSLAHGNKACLPLAAGGVTGDALCICASLLGLTTLLTVFSTGFLVIKYLGAAYLIYLGIKMIRSNLEIDSRQYRPSTYNARLIFREAFLVNALNPKGIIFYSAFMPQFVNPEQNIGLQLLLLAVSFLGLAVINVVVYSLLASKINRLFISGRFTKTFNLTGGLSLICAGLYSATLEKK